MLGSQNIGFTGAAVTVDASAALNAQDQSQGFFLVPGFKIAAIANVALTSSEIDFPGKDARRLASCGSEGH
jgi:hypothetical protein